MCILFRCHAIEAVLTFYVVLQSFLCGSMWGVCEAQLCFKEPGDICQGDTRETLGRHVPPLLFIFLLRDPSHLSSPSPLPGDQRIHLKEAPHSSLTEPSQQPHRDLIAASQSPHSSEPTPLSRFAKENLGGVRRVWESLFFAMVTIIQWKWRRKKCKWTLSCTFWGVPVWRSEILGGTSLDTLTFSEIFPFRLTLRYQWKKTTWYFWDLLPLRRMALRRTLALTPIDFNKRSWYGWVLIKTRLKPSGGDKLWSRSLNQSFVAPSTISSTLFHLLPQSLLSSTLPLTPLSSF